MLDPIVNFFTRIFQWIGRGIGLVIGVILWPFMWFGRWYTQRGWILKAILGVVIVGLFGLYIHFVWTTQYWANFNTEYIARYKYDDRHFSAGEAVTIDSGTNTAKTCGRSGVAEVTADLIDFNVNQNPWVSSMILYKLGFFGLPWDSTPFLDNKASFQRGIQRAVSRTATDLVDNLARVRGTSGIDPDLDRARGSLQYDQFTWYISVSRFGFTTPSPTYYRSAILDIRKFNDKLQACGAVFDARADNLGVLLDRVANDIGNTSAALRERAEKYNAGWFDTHADNLFWEAYGQLYAYYGILTAAHADFEDVIREKHLDNLFDNMEGQFRSALRIQPFIISNGREDGWIMPTHLTTMGFYVLRVRSNLVEIRNVLQQ
jgi:hypothetical protein